MLILDTSIIIDHLRTLENSRSLFLQVSEQFPKEKIAVSVITVQELYLGKSTKNELKEKELLASISPLKILPYTYETAMLAGQLARDLKRPLLFADAAIAATTLLQRGELYTLNTKDFEAIPNLELFHLEQNS